MSDYEPREGDMLRVQGGKQYLPVAARVQWFRGDHPDWAIDTSVVGLDWSEGYAIMRAEVRSADGCLIASGTKTETRKGFGDFVEKAETGAVGRALARAGYGTEDALDLEGDRLADAPIQQPPDGERADPARRGSRQPATTRPAASRSPEEQQLLDELLATGASHAQMRMMADALGIPPGQHATADQLREMLRRMTQPSSGVPTAPAGGEAGSSVPASPTDTPQPDPVQPEAATTSAGEASPLSPPASAPTLDDVLEATGGELLPPKPGTDEYKRLAAPEKAAARAYWQSAEVAL